MERRCQNRATLWLNALLLIGAKLSFAQPSHKNYEVEARAHLGYLYFQNDQYHSALGRYSMHAPAYEFSLHRNTYGQHRWEVVHNYPSIGFTFYYSPFHNYSVSEELALVSKELGHAFALYPYINFHVAGSQKSKLTFKLGVGLAYLTNKFNATENYHNYAIGSHLNAAVNLSFEYRQRIFERLHWVTSVGLTHFSNGGTMTPNMGINIFSMATGFSWYLLPPKSLIDSKMRPKPDIYEFDGKRHFVTDVQYTLGYKDLSQKHGTHQFYLVHNLAAQVMLLLSERDRLGIGAEIIIDPSEKIVQNWNSSTKLGVLLAYEMMLDRVSFMFNVGVRNNVSLDRMKEKFAGLFYQKVGAHYYFNDNLFATLSFTTYDIKADFISVGIGYHFQHKYYLPYHEKKPRRSPVYPR